MQLRLTDLTLDGDRLTARQARTLIARTRGNKYRNRRVTIDGIRFDSVREAKRWRQLTLLQSGGAIDNLRRQVRFQLIVADKLVCTYIADFTYTDDAGRTVVEDSKGVRTATYRIKRKLFEALNPSLQISEV